MADKTDENGYYIDEAPLSSKAKNIIIGLVLALVCGGGYLYNLQAKANKYKAEMDLYEEEKAQQIIRLTKLNNQYNTLLIENNEYKTEIEMARNESMKLMKEVEETKDGDVILKKYKERITELESRLSVISLENKILKNQNESLTERLDETTSKLNELKKGSEKEPKVIVNSVSKPLENTGDFQILYLKASAFNISKAKVRTQTEKAKETNFINFSFTIPESRTIKAGVKSYYIQLVNSDNKNVFSKDKILTDKGSQIDYCCKTSVAYLNKTLKVNLNLLTSNVSKGIYKVNVYDKNDKLSETTLTLK